jgi:hypothetical protein
MRTPRCSTLKRGLREATRGFSPRSWRICSPSAAISANEHSASRYSVSGKNHSPLYVAGPVTIRSDPAEESRVTIEPHGRAPKREKSIDLPSGTF